MENDLNSVIAALQVALSEAQDDCGEYWDVDAVNRWIGLLPDARDGRWSQLTLAGDCENEVLRTLFIGHVRATLAYLETYRQSHICGPSSATAHSDGPIDVDFKDISNEPRQVRHME